MRRLWLWENGDTTLQEYPPMGKGQWIENCKFCGKIPKIIDDEKEKETMIFCINRDCIDNKKYSIEEWNMEIKQINDFQNPSYESISLEERVKRLEERLHKIDGITMY